MRKISREHIWGGASFGSNNYDYNENPWDGSDIMINSVKERTMNSLELKRPLLIFAIILSLFALLFAGKIHAGKVVEKSKSSSTETSRSTNETSSRDAKAPKDRDAAEIAEEYAYLLEQLLYLSSDYCRYFKNVDDTAAIESYKALAQMCTRISEDEHYENVAKILSEIGELKKELAAREYELARLQEELDRESAGVRKDKSNKRALILTSTLLEELESLNEQIERDVVWRIEKNSYDKDAIQQYVRAIVDDSLIKYVSEMGLAYSVPKVVVHPNHNGEPEAVAIGVGQTPEVDVSVAPELPTPPTPSVPAIGHFTKASHFKEIRDSLPITSSNIDISVTNVFGDVIVTNSPDEHVFSTYSVGIVSDNEEFSDKFGDEIQLKITPKANKVYVEAIAPIQKELAARIVESRLEVLVPKKNNVSINNKFGNVSVSDLKNGVDVKSSLGNIEIIRIDGSVTLVNSSGTVNVSKIDGSVNLQNKMGPITLYKCNGAIEVDNSFGHITMEDCRGDAVIRNTGPIEVDDHTGAIEITNRNGLISVENVDGNISVFNSFETIVVSKIKGSAKIVNANALVSLADVTGLASVNNRFGDITGINLSGPLAIENKSGDIILSLGTIINGNSSIVSNGGDISMLVPPASNLSIDFESRGGNIQIAGFDSKVSTDHSGFKSAELILGKGANRLAVRAIGSNISVDRSQ